ncbi:hypothetical protein ACFSL6_27560 [Paenibacillus thailandensis]|uniref:Uncharacterized protein n=1 Tax=Paenibacillus thailandensis TaxID=393250 RepID=A0ABW5QYF9_9BACL
MREGHGHKGKHGHREHREHRGHGHKHGMREFAEHHSKSAQTFRRGRAIAFLDKLMVNRSTLQRQLNDPQFESIKSVISGELKATETIIEEFIHMFQLHEISPDANVADDANPEGENPTDENNG